MRLLRLVGSDENGTSLILETLESEDGVDGARFTLPIDDRLRSATASKPAGAAAAPPVDAASVPTPREIQVRVRAGETAQAIADEAGIPLERVMRFAYPVLQERIRVTDEARRARARRGGDGLLVPFGELLDGRLARHGIDPASVRWDAFRREDGGWTVTSEFSAQERGVLAKFSFALLNRTITALDDIAADLLSDRPVQALLAPPPPPVIEPVAEDADADWASDWEGGAPPRLAAVPNPGRSERPRSQEATPAVRPPARRQKAHTRPVPVSNEDELFDQDAFDQQPWHEPPLPFELGAGRSAGGATATAMDAGREQARAGREAPAVADRAPSDPEAGRQAAGAEPELRQSEALDDLDPDVLDPDVLELAVLDLDEADDERGPGMLESMFDSANREPVTAETAVAGERAAGERAAGERVAGEPAGAERPAAAEPAVAESGEPQLKRGRRTGEKPRMPSWDDILLGVRHKSD